MAGFNKTLPLNKVYWIYFVISTLIGVIENMFYSVFNHFDLYSHEDAISYEALNKYCGLILYDCMHEE